MPLARLPRRELHGEIPLHVGLRLRAGAARLEPAGGESRPHLLEHAAGGGLIEILVCDRGRGLLGVALRQLQAAAGPGLGSATPEQLASTG